MARNGSGTASLLAPLAVASTVSSSTSVNSTMDDVAEMLTDSVNIDGTKAWEANQSVGGFKFTSVGDGSVRTDNISYGQVQDGKANWVAAGGTADVITATYAPAITALVDGQECNARASGANTVTTPTFSPNGLTARTIVKNGGSALAVGDIPAAGYEMRLRYLLASTRWELQNPAGAVTATASTTEVLTGTNTAKAITPDANAALWEAGADITDGAAITIGEGGYFNLITSTTAITSFSITTDKAGRSFKVRFNTIRTLTHNGTSLIIPGAANITTAAGDIAFIRSLGGGNVVVEAFTKASGLPIASPALTIGVPDLKTSGTTYTTSATCTTLLVEVIGGGGAGGAGTAGTGGGSGGGGGGYARKLYTVTPSTGYTYAVAAAGGDSTFTDGVTLITGNNGAAGSAGSANGVQGGAGGTGTNGDVNLSGGQGGPAAGYVQEVGGQGGSSGGGYGQGGGGGSETSAGSAGALYGGGGGGGGEATGPAGGAGAAGAVIFTPYN